MGEKALFGTGQLVRVMWKVDRSKWARAHLRLGKKCTGLSGLASLFEFILGELRHTRDMLASCCLSLVNSVQRSLNVYPNRPIWHDRSTLTDLGTNNAKTFRCSLCLYRNVLKTLLFSPINGWLSSNNIKLKIILPCRVLRQTFKHVSFSPHSTFQGSFLDRDGKTHPVRKKLRGLQTEGRACDEKEEEEKWGGERARQMTCWRFVCLLKSAVLSLALYKPTLARRPDTLSSPCCVFSYA